MKTNSNTYQVRPSNNDVTSIQISFQPMNIALVMSREHREQTHCKNSSYVLFINCASLGFSNNIFKGVFTE